MNYMVVAARVRGIPTNTETRIRDMNNIVVAARDRGIPTNTRRRELETLINNMAGAARDSKR